MGITHICKNNIYLPPMFIICYISTSWSHNFAKSRFLCFKIFTHNQQKGIDNLAFIRSFEQAYGVVYNIQGTYNLLLDWHQPSDLILLAK